MLEARALNLTLDFCLRVGELLLSSGAGAADVTATMQSLAYHFGVRHPDIDVTFTSLSMSYQASPEEPPVIQVRQVKQRDIDYEDLTLVDHLVRDVLERPASTSWRPAPAGPHRLLGPQHPALGGHLGWGVMCAGVGAAARRHLTVDRDRVRRRGLHRPAAAADGAPAASRSSTSRSPAGGVATVLALGASATGLDVDPSLVVTANIIMLLAGIGFMGALQDALSGFYVTAGARLTEALLATAGIIAGVSGGLTLGAVLRRRASASSTPASSSWESVTDGGPSAARSVPARSRSPATPRRGSSRRSR